MTETFNNCLTSGDLLIVLDIYYAGGTADTSISAADLLSGVQGPRTESGLSRTAVSEYVTAFAQDGDFVIVMGARDPTLTDLAHDIVGTLSEKSSVHAE